MTQHHFSRLCAAVILLAVSVLFPDAAHARLNPKFGDVKIYSSAGTEPVIEVFAEGEAWTEVRQSELAVSLQYHVSMKKGKIQLIRGFYSAWAQYGFDPNLAAETNAGSKTKSGTFQTKITGKAMDFVKLVAIAKCNDFIYHGETGNKIDRDYTTYIDLGFSLFVRAKRVGNESTRTAPGQVQAKVICRKAPKTSWVDNFSVEIENTEQCPKKATVKVSFRSTRQDPISFQIQQYFGVGGKKAKIRPTDLTDRIRVTAFGLGNQYIASYSTDFALDPGQHGFAIIVRNGKNSAIKRVSVTCPPFRVLSATLEYVQIADAICPKRVWETAKFFTSRPGNVRYQIRQGAGDNPNTVPAAGGHIHAEQHDGDKYIAVVQRVLNLSAVDTDMRARARDDTNTVYTRTRLKVTCMDVLSSKLDILKLDDRKCPKKAFVRATYETSQQGGIRDFLRCNDGSEQTGIINAARQGGKFIATRTMTVDIKKSTTLKCSARAQDFAARTAVFAEQRFRCGSDAGSSDVTVQPDPVEPPPPARKLSGDFQFVDRANRKRCPRRVRAVINFEHGSNVGVRYALACTTGTYTGLAASRKVNGRYVAPAVETFAIPKGTKGKSHVNCALKSISPGKPRLHEAKGRTFACINPTADPVGGFNSTETPPSAATSISCKRGKVRNGKCVCGSRRDLKKLGSKRFTCVKKHKAETISCRRGRVRHGKCMCASRRVLKKMGKHRFACVKKARPVLRHSRKARKRSRRHRNRKRRNRNHQ